MADRAPSWLDRLNTSHSGVVGLVIGLAVVGAIGGAYAFVNAERVSPRLAYGKVLDRGFMGGKGQNPVATVQVGDEIATVRLPSIEMCRPGQRIALDRHAKRWGDAYTYRREGCSD